VLSNNLPLLVRETDWESRQTQASLLRINRMQVRLNHWILEISWQLSFKFSGKFTSNTIDWCCSININQLCYWWTRQRTWNSAVSWFQESKWNCTTNASHPSQSSELLPYMSLVTRENSWMGLEKRTFILQLQTGLHDYACSYTPASVTHMSLWYDMIQIFLI